MKIVSVSMVKNESDIIESFIRYTLSFVDEMIILDNGSTDETTKIVDNLINEGLSIVLIHDKDKYYNQSIKTTKLLKKAVNEYGADLVCILDVDEFIFTNGNNPRDDLEKLDPNYYYLIKLIHYIPTPDDDYDIKFIPKRITHCAEPPESVYKVIVPKKIVKDNNVEVLMGNHDLKFKGLRKSNLSKYAPNLKIAHYCIRSKEQCMSKILVGWPNMVAVYTESTDFGWHWKEFFNKIKRYNDISPEELEYFSKCYVSMANPDEVILEYEPINLDFCKSIEIKYIFQYNYLNNILESYVNFANEVALLKRELDFKTGKTGLIQGLKMKIVDLILK